ncbi:MAG: hypothetical protein NTW86_18675, partial [Candidatus Sumerlaeota bacterium]|nr:hypothetical protein [Candidatus Sumerlaeota bacterium]
GTPHTPSDAWSYVHSRSAGTWRLVWDEEIYGTWLVQIIVYQNGVGWIQTDGPSGTSLWHFLDYGGLAYDPAKASFLDGWADFTLPPGGSYVFFLNFRAWDGVTEGPFAFAETY